MVDVLAIDESVHLRLLVRRSLPLADGAYVALGEAVDDDRAAYLGYGFGADF